MSDISQINIDNTLYDLKDKSARTDLPVATISNASVLTDAAYGEIQQLRVYGHSELVDGSVKSVADNGELTITTRGKNLLEITNKAQTKNGISYYYDENTGTLVVHGTPTTDTVFDLTNGNHQFSTECKMYSTYTSNLAEFLGIQILDSSNTEVAITEEDFAYETGGAIIPVGFYGKVQLYIKGSYSGQVQPLSPVIATTEDIEINMLVEPPHSATAAITTGMPLRSVINKVGFLQEVESDELIIDQNGGKVVTRCYYDSDSNNVKLLDQPVVSVLTDAELDAFRTLRTYTGYYADPYKITYGAITHIDITDNPQFTIQYLKNTNSGQVASNIQSGVKSAIAELSTNISNMQSENLISASASGTSFTLTDAADGIVQGLTVYGKSTDDNGVIKSVGDSQITFTTSNGTSSGTAALSSGIPLRGIPVLNPITETTYTDENGNEWFADEANIYTGKVIKRCGVVDLGTLNWVYNTTGEFFGSNDITELMLPTPRSAICAGYNFVGSVPVADWLNVPTMSFGITTSSTSGLTSIRIKNTDYTNATAFKAAVSGVYLIYQLAVPTETLLSGSELAAFAALRTFAGTTNVSTAEQTESFIAPYMDISYLRNTGNGQAAADLQTALQAQIEDHETRLEDLEAAIAEIGGN